jgi:hypothetical protein
MVGASAIRNIRVCKLILTIRLERVAKSRAPQPSRSPSAPRRENPGAEPEPLPVAPLRENQGLETDRLRRRLSPGILTTITVCYRQYS